MTAIEKIILKHYGKQAFNKDGSRKSTRGWEKCGNEIQNLIRDKETAIRGKNLQYSEECRAIDKIRREIENQYERYFAKYNLYGTKAGYDWIKGNNNLKTLLNEHN